MLLYQLSTVLFYWKIIAVHCTSNNSEEEQASCEIIMQRSALLHVFELVIFEPHWKLWKVVLLIPFESYPLSVSKGTVVLSYPAVYVES